MANRTTGNSVFERIKKRFGPTRRLNMNPKNNKVDLTLMTPEEKIIILANEVYGKPDQYSVRESLVIGLELKEKEYEQSPSDLLKTEIEEVKKHLDLFDEEIRKLKEEEKKQERERILAETEEEHRLFKNIKDSEKRINDIVADFNKATEDLIKTLDQNDHGSISILISLITNSYADYNANLKTLNAQLEEYKNHVGKDDYKPEHNMMVLSNEQVEKIYRGIKIRIDELSEKKFAFNKNKYIKKYQSFITTLPTYLENKDDFKDIKEKVDAELANENLNPAEKAKEEAQTKIDELLEKLFEQYKKDFKNHKVNLTSLIVKSEVLGLVEDYDVLSSDEKEELVNNAVQQFKAMINKEYGQELLEIVEEANKIQRMINELASIEYGTPEFDEKYKEVIDYILKTKDSDLFKKNHAELIYYKNTQKIHFVFPSDKVDDITIDIVPENVKEQIRINTGQTQPPTPVSSKNQEDKKKELEEKIDKKLNELFEKYKKEVKALDIKIEKVTIMAEIGNIVDDYDLTKEEKEEYLNNSIAEFTNKIIAEYGEDLKTVIDNVLLIKEKIAELSTIEYTDPEFEIKHKKIVESIKILAESEEAKNAKVKIVYDKSVEKAHFIFEGDKVDDLTIDVVSEKVKEQMKQSGEKPTPATPPKTEETKTEFEEEKNKAIDAYIKLLDELKEEINKLNYCNKAIEAAAEITFDTLSSDKIDYITAIEKAALAHNKNIINKNLELSNARANLRTKFKSYAGTIKEIAEYQMPKVEFGKDYKEFISYYDEMIVIAEKKIISLDEERQAEYTPASRFDELTAEMKEIARYIETVNSLIGRRIAAESVENGLDIVSVLSQRREDKKEIRKKIQEMLDKKAAEKPKVNQEEAERDLKERLTAIYKEWLEQIKYSNKSNTVTVNDEMFEDRIKAVVENSQAERKYKIAEDLKNQFEEDKKQLFITQNENDYRLAIQQVLRDSILKVIKDIRKNPNYKDNFDAICFDEETINKLNEIASSSDVQTKYSILAEEKQAYLEKIKEIIKIEQIDTINSLNAEIEQKLQEISMLEVNDELEMRIKAKFETLITKYSEEFTRLEIKYEIEDNRITIYYPHKLFNGIGYGNEIARVEVKAMSLEMYEKYVEYKKHEVEPTPEPEKVEPEEIKQEEVDIAVPLYKVDNGRKLNLSVAKPTIVNKQQGLVMKADVVQLTLIKNGLKIKYSQELRRQLQELNAKLILVKKGESKVRATRKIKEQNEEDIVTIKRKIDEFNPEDYKVQIRADKYDEQGNKLRGTDLVFEMDIEEELSSVLEQGRSR